MPPSIGNVTQPEILDSKIGARTVDLANLRMLHPRERT